MKKKWLAVGIILLFIGVAILPNICAEIQKERLRQKESFTNTLLLKAHTKIRIRDNSDFVSRNGVVGGRGTKDDPYLISGWNFNGISWKKISTRIENLMSRIDFYNHPYRFALVFLFLFALYTLFNPSAIRIQNTNKYVIIRGNNFENWTRSISIINATHVIIETNTINIESNPLYGSNTGIDLSRTNSISIERNTISSCYYAIHIEGNNTYVEENQIRNCQAGIGADGSNVFIRKNTILSINGLCSILLVDVKGTALVEDCYIQNCTFDGGIICFNKTEQAIIRNNTLIHSRGFAAITGDSGLIENNTIVDSDTGIQCEYSIIQYNFVKSCAIGIAVNGPSNIMHNNISLSTIGIGCYYNPGGHSFILNNSIHNNHKGIYCIGDRNPFIHDNNIYENNAGFVYEGGSIINATHNWWGASDGPSGSGPGSGDSVSDDINYIPWLTSPNPNAGR
jgi:parallel beta-helix repeat protein